MKLRFTKMHGLGNDFLMLNAVTQAVELAPNRIRQLADRHFGVGFDQLLVVEPAQHAEADFRYRIFNTDGSEVEQCGNGARCVAVFIRDEGLSDRNPLVVETVRGCLQLSIDDDGQVTVDMGAPVFDPDRIPFQVDRCASDYTLRVDEQELQVDALSMGNPHVVLRVDRVDTAPVARLGPLIGRHERFPQGVNVGFVEVVGRDHVRLRVYERGAGETLACGSGACAAVVVGQRRGWLESPVTVDLPGGSLGITWPGPDQPVIMTGPATCVFRGEFDC